MKNWATQGTIQGPVVFIIYTLALQYLLNYCNVSDPFFADDTQIYFKLDSEAQCVLKGNTILNAVQTWMFIRKLKSNKVKTIIMVAGYHLQIRNIDSPSSSDLVHPGINLSTKTEKSRGYFWLKCNSQVSYYCSKTEGYVRSY